VKRLTLAVGGLVALGACLPPRRIAAPPASGPASFGVLRRVPPSQWPPFLDNGHPDDLKRAIDQSLAAYRRRAGKTVAFGTTAVPVAEMAETLAAFQKILRRPSDEWTTAFRDTFDLYRSVGDDGRGAVTFSAYYVHTLAGSLSKSSVYKYPIYARPLDLAERSGKGGAKEMGRIVGERWAPYFTRADIDSGNALKGRGLEIAWAADPLDIFLLQVQGSGWLKLPDGRMLRLRFDGHNGHPYRSLGQHLLATGRIPRAGFNRKVMKDYLAKHSRERQGLLNVNPRYVFSGSTEAPRRRTPWEPWASR
jgi:membrane-bound lytic murein transglycosylase A